MSRMKSIASVLSIIALGFGLLGCSSSGGGGGGGSTSAFAVSTTAANFGVVGQCSILRLSRLQEERLRSRGPMRRWLADWDCHSIRHRCRVWYTDGTRQGIQL